MIITRIYVDNFKSLVDFTIQPAKFTCLIGLNGSGKSTVLQFYDFLAQQFKGDITSWLKQRNWSAADLNSRLSNKSNIDFHISLRWNENQIEWQASFNRRELRSTRERIQWNGQTVLKVEDGRFTVSKPSADRTPGVLQSGDISFSYQGSIVSQLKAKQLPDELITLKTFFQEICALDMLSPALLRQKTRSSQGSLGIGGERLSAFVCELELEKQEKILHNLQQAYPQLKQISVKSLRSGWKQLHIDESFGEKTLHTEARHINDGLLRILAIFAQLATPQSIMLLDEIENGINPELVEFLLDMLVQSSPQIVVTTHSPLILNYLEDDVAKAGVVYLHKNNYGHTKAVRFFDIPSMAAKLEVMGPGEVYEDTILNELACEIDAMGEED